MEGSELDLFLLRRRRRRREFTVWHHRGAARKEARPQQEITAVLSRRPLGVEGENKTGQRNNVVLALGTPESADPFLRSVPAAFLRGADFS